MIATCLLAVLLVQQAKADGPPFPAAEPSAVGIDPAALERLRARAERANSDAVLIVKDGKLIADWTFGKPAGPIHAMSMTKSIVGLAIGRLIDQGKIRSLDQPVSDFYPEWKQGRKRRITLRHILNHTSGLEIPAFTGEIYTSPDFVQFALASDLSDDPGARFVYNNKAVNILSGIIHNASGRRMDVYIGEEIFKPLGITDYTWSLDDAGNPHALAGLHIRAVDLARIGQMMLDGGTWRGRRIVSEDWIRLSTTKPGQPHDPTSGLLWWLLAGREFYKVDDAMIATLKQLGLTDDSLRKVEALRAKEYNEWGELEDLRPILQADKVARRKLNEIDGLVRTGRLRARKMTGPPEGFSAMGHLGQYLVVIPKHRLVAVRQIRPPTPIDSKVDEFGEFSRMVRDLVPAAAKSGDK